MLHLLLILFTILWLVLIAYNLFLSPLRHIPGPLISQIFPFYDYYYLVIGQFHSYVTKLHEVYGPVVRLGGDRIVLTDPNAWKEIHSTYKYPKTHFYNHMRTVGWSMITINDRAAHSSRRRAVAKTFSEANVLKLEGVVVEDVMGKLVFCKNLDILKTTHHEVLDWNRKLVVWIVLNAALPPFRLIGNPYFKNVALFAKESIDLRRNSTDEKQDLDILGSLLEAKDPLTDEKISDLDLMEECAELLVAGSDTTAHTLTWFLYALLKNPDSKLRVIEEIDHQFKDGAQITMKLCQSLLYFQACLKETLRLYPVGAHPLFREVPDSGATICGYNLPPKTEIFTSVYALHHSPKLWENPAQFLPQRWLSQTNDALINPKDYTFLPFSTGPRNCPGRYLANMELNLVVVNLLYHFELNLVDPKLELNPVSYIALQPAGHEPLLVSFKKRN